MEQVIYAGVAVGRQRSDVEEADIETAAAVCTLRRAGTPLDR
jgi:hypothetical protein